MPASHACRGGNVTRRRGFADRVDERRGALAQRARARPAASRRSAASRRRRRTRPASRARSTLIPPAGTGSAGRMPAHGRARSCRDVAARRRVPREAAAESGKDHRVGAEQPEPLADHERRRDAHRARVRGMRHAPARRCARARVSTKAGMPTSAGASSTIATPASLRDFRLLGKRRRRADQARRVRARCPVSCQARAIARWHAETRCANGAYSWSASPWSSLMTSTPARASV